jgi:hypothetical protein
LHQDHFLHSSDEAVKSAVGILLKKSYGTYPTVAAAAAAAAATTTAARSQGRDGACNEVESPPSNEGTKSNTAVDDETQPDSTSEEDKPPLRSGLKIVDIDFEAEFLQSLQKHAAKCGNVMHPDKPRKIGFDALTRWHCPVCATEIVQRSGRDAKRIGKGHRGPPPSEINRLVSASCFECGVASTKAGILLGG